MFKNDFIFGAATAAYQIEGAHDRDGKTPSIWDVFSHKEGKIANGDNGDVACDHYHLYENDIALMKEIGLDSYRFSVSWPRVIPHPGHVNEKGIDFYNRLIDELLENGISPMLTLYHWDLPQWMYEKGGWISREICGYFDDYSALLFNKFGDRVKYWVTHNEPYCISMLGHLYGQHAPGHKNLQDAIRTAHHLLLTHGRALNIFRQTGLKSKIGITLNLGPAYPYSETETDKLAASRYDGFANRWFLEPLFKGQYPKDMFDYYESNHIDFSHIQDGDLKIINGETDFLGVNYYMDFNMRYDRDAFLQGSHVDMGRDKTAMGWEISPEGFIDIVRQIRENYTDIPVMITENGSAFKDEIKNGEIEDTERLEYLKSHLEAVVKMNEEGLNVTAYYVWSLMDNFEWAFGYDKRFGIIGVDYETQKRIIKKSGRYYSNIIKTRSL